MKWYRVSAVIVCSLNAMLGALVLCYSTFHYLIDKSTNAPTTPNKEWIRVITNIIPFSATWIIISLAGIFVSMAKHQAYLTTMVLVLYLVVFGSSIYFMVTFKNQNGMEDVKAEVLFQKTLKEINSHKSQYWIPDWLDKIQKQSKNCCGLVTYRDYEAFWPYDSERMPRSCCRASEKLPENCPEDLYHIPYPNTPATYFKIEAGCMGEINVATRRRIQEASVLSIIMTAFLGCAVLVLVIVYVKTYLLRGSKSRRLSKKIRTGGGDANLDGSQEYVNNEEIEDNGAFMSSGQIFCSFASIENAKPLSPDESVVSQEIKIASISSSDKLQQVPTLQSTLFAGLPQQLPEASTGDDMTIGGGSMGRKEVFVAQDMTDSIFDSRLVAEPKHMASNFPQQKNVSSRNRNPLLSSSQNDIAGDKVHVDPEPTFNQPTHLEKRKRKKGRRFTLQRPNDQN